MQIVFKGVGVLPKTLSANYFVIDQSFSFYSFYKT